MSQVESDVQVRSEEMFGGVTLVMAGLAVVSETAAVEVVVVESALLPHAAIKK
jgi:hypothetical protein